MSVSRSLRLVASATGSMALAAGVLALTPSSPADAATATGAASYTCTTPLGQSFQVPAMISLSNLPETLTAGVPIPAGTLLNLGLDSNSLTTALGSTVLGANYAVNQVSTQIGTTPVTNTVTNPILTSLGVGLLGIGGTLGTFTPQSADLPLPIPTSFDLTATLLGLPVLGSSIPCTLNQSSTSSTTTVYTMNTGSGGGGSTQPVSVAKQKSTVKVHQVGGKAKLRVQVRNQTGKATGKVVAKLHGKKVGKGVLTQGKARLNLKHLKKGVSRIKVYYQGDAVSQAAHGAVRVRIGRG